MRVGGLRTTTANPKVSRRGHRYCGLKTHGADEAASRVEQTACPLILFQDMHIMRHMLVIHNAHQGNT